MAKTTTFNMRTDPAFMQEIDEWRSEKRPIPTRAEALRTLATKGMEADRAEGKKQESQ